MKVTRDGRRMNVDVTPDGVGLVSHAGSGLLPGVADRVGLTAALSEGLVGVRERRAGHDPGRVICDLAVMLADGGDCLSDLRGVRDRSALFGAVASDSTAFRVIEKIACTPGLLDALDGAHGRARWQVWKLTGPPGRVTIDLDATLLTCHSEKEGAAGNFKGGYGFHPMLAYCDETRESMAALLRPGNAGANTATDQIAVAEAALEQIPRSQIATIDVLLRVDSAGEVAALTDIVDWQDESGLAQDPLGTWHQPREGRVRGGTATRSCDAPTSGTSARPGSPRRGSRRGPGSATARSHDGPLCDGRDDHSRCVRAAPERGRNRRRSARAWRAAPPGQRKLIADGPPRFNARSSMCASPRARVRSSICSTSRATGPGRLACPRAVLQALAASQQELLTPLTDRRL